jgi:Domain of unknown function (DUF4431)
MKVISYFILFYPFFSFASNLQLNYEPAIVELTGSLDVQTFAGPPNFESISDGDQVERSLYFKLDAPIDVATNLKNNPAKIDESEKNVKVVQLIILNESQEHWAKSKSLTKGSRTKIRGTLSHSITGHHHARILLTVKNVESPAN